MVRCHQNIWIGLYRVACVEYGSMVMYMCRFGHSWWMRSIVECVSQSQVDVMHNTRICNNIYNNNRLSAKHHCNHHFSALSAQHIHSLRRTTINVWRSNGQWACSRIIVLNQLLMFILHCIFVANRAYAHNTSSLVLSTNDNGNNGDWASPIFGEFWLFKYIQYVYPLYGVAWCKMIK